MDYSYWFSYDNLRCNEYWDFIFIDEGEEKHPEKFNCYIRSYKWNPPHYMACFIIGLWRFTAI